VVNGYINLDLFALPGVDLVADAEMLPFALRPVSTRGVRCGAGTCPLSRSGDAGDRASAGAGGFAHIVTPFCHPFHEYPRDYRRFTLDGLKQMTGGLEVVAEGWRTGPTATLLVFVLEYAKLLLPWRAWRVIAHGVVGWLIFPLRYLDLLFFRSPNVRRIGNHCYLWLRKPVLKY